MKKIVQDKKLNPLNFFEIRQLEVPAPHFEYLVIPMRYNLQSSIEKWIADNLKGRFYVGKCVDINSEDKIDTMIKIGFEEPKELSYFTLACPLLKYK